MNSKGDAVGLGNEHLSVGLLAQDLLELRLPRIDCACNLAQCVAVDDVVDDEKALFIESSRLLLADDSKRTLDRFPPKAVVVGMELRRGLRGGFAHLVLAPVDSATSSIRSRTRMLSSSERDFTASSIIVMQKGHPTATHLGLASFS